MRAASEEEMRAASEGEFLVLDAVENWQAESHQAAYYEFVQGSHKFLHVLIFGKNRTVGLMFVYPNRTPEFQKAFLDIARTVLKKSLFGGSVRRAGADLSPERREGDTVADLGHVDARDLVLFRNSARTGYAREVRS